MEEEQLINPYIYGTIVWQFVLKKRRQAKQALSIRQNQILVVVFIRRSLIFIHYSSTRSEAGTLMPTVFASLRNKSRDTNGLDVNSSDILAFNINFLSKAIKMRFKLWTVASSAELTGSNIDDAGGGRWSRGGMLKKIRFQKKLFFLFQLFRMSIRQFSVLVVVKSSGWNARHVGKFVDLAFGVFGSCTNLN